jgi:hypothetical protein
MSTELARRTDVVSNLDDVQRVAKLLALSGYFEAKGATEQAVAQLATKVLAGREMGFSPFASANGIHIIQGKPTVSANLMASAVKGSQKYDYRVREMTEVACRIEFFERINGKLESIGVSSFTLDEAKRAGTQNLQKYPKNMLFARCMSNGVRWYTPDVFSSSVYTPEEMGAAVDAEGEIIEVPASPVVEATPAQPTLRWATPQDALTWATLQGMDFQEARDLLASIKQEHGGKLNAQTAEIIYEDFATEVDRWQRSQAADDTAQPQLLHGGAAVYN